MLKLNIYMEIIVYYPNLISECDKLTNRHGGKGVISKIEPDENGEITINNNWDLYNSRVDVRTNFYFLTKDLDEPNKEARDTIKFYQDMYSRIGKDNIYKIVVPKYYYDPEAKGKKKYQENNPKIEKYLYILHKCGVVDNWEVSYLINELEFKILFDSEYKNIEYILNRKKSEVFKNQLLK